MNMLLVMLACAPLGGGAKLVKLINAAAAAAEFAALVRIVVLVAVGAKVPLLLFEGGLDKSSEVDKLASNAANASGANVCEKLKGGNGTLPGSAVV